MLRMAPIARVHPRQLRKLLRRAAVLWLVVRITVTVFTVALKQPPPIVLPPVVAICMLLVLALLAQVDARVMRETLFHENLGAPRRIAAAIAVAVAASFELLIAGGAALWL